ncbi:phenylalanine--tRNA ligase subunit beta [Ruminococcaceae bacterium OttesenSCG-928-A16]|nr:phenylalanine--tRNA ligase subunit beta [Ruminococcaceae bacterium OttesenSCG-928-A16]
MKMPLKWAQDYAKFTCTPAEFADKMTMSGSKVETYESEADTIKNVVIGQIKTLEKHPDSDHLWICAVDVGSEVIQIVTGAQNLKVGDVCPVALHGAKLPGGKEIKRGKLRGVESNGMLCGIDELGLTLHDFPNAIEDGIFVLDFEAPLGADATEALGMNDIAFEFEITPNRPDCLSVRGLAREAAATFGVPFEDHVPKVPAGKGDVHSLLKVKVEASDICSRYSAAIVENVRIKPSPQWMRERLRLSGVRPINNIVDITNYVMLEYGHPMHAFDFAYVNGGSITVRRAKAGEEIVTLDGTQRALTPDMMVIADEKGPVAIAGVMGGEYSGVYDTTNRIVFEAACFDGPSVRATSKKLGLRTESSGRFEKGLNPENAAPALHRALELVALLDAGDIVAGIVDDYPAPRLPREIPFNPGAINRLLGIELTEQQMVDILLPLGFGIQGGTITVPSSRYDVARDCDIAEEVARFVGYNKIPSTVMVGAATARPTARQTFTRTLCTALTGYGFWESETFSFYSPKSFDMINLPQNSPLRGAVKILNPLGEDTSIMRTTALPSMLEVVARNWASRNEEAALFEQATEYLPAENSDNLPQENQKIVLAAYGANWGYSALKGTVEGLLHTAGIAGFEVEANTEGTTYHPGRCANIYVQVPVANAPPVRALVATLGEIHPAVTANYGIKPRVVAADISLDVLFAVRGGTPEFTPLPKFPATTRDLALVANLEVPAATIAGRIQAAAGKNLESLTLFDVYTGEKIASGKKSLAYSLVLRGKNATLTDQDADHAVAKVLKSLAEIGVELRS